MKGATSVASATGAGGVQPAAARPYKGNAKLFVGGLSHAITEAQFRKYFEAFGEVVDVLVQKDRGFGFVQFSDPATAQKVLLQPVHRLFGKLIEPKSCVTGKNDVERDEHSVINKRIFVGGISRETTERDIRSCFAKYGKVREVQIMYDRNTALSRRFAFVSFADEGTVGLVCRLQFVPLNGKNVECKLAQPEGYTRLKKTQRRPNFHKFHDPKVNVPGTSGLQPEKAPRFCKQDGKAQPRQPEKSIRFKVTPEMVNPGATSMKPESAGGKKKVHFAEDCAPPNSQVESVTEATAQSQAQPQTAHDAGAEPKTVVKAAESSSPGLFISYQYHCTPELTPPLNSSSSQQQPDRFTYEPLLQPQNYYPLLPPAIGLGGPNPDYYNPSNTPGPNKFLHYDYRGHISGSNTTTTYSNNWSPLTDSRDWNITGAPPRKMATPPAFAYDVRAPEFTPNAIADALSTFNLNNDLTLGEIEQSGSDQYQGFGQRLQSCSDQYWGFGQMLQSGSGSSSFNI